MVPVDIQAHSGAAIRILEASYPGDERPYWIKNFNELRDDVLYNMMFSLGWVRLGKQRVEGNRYSLYANGLPKMLPRVVFPVLEVLGKAVADIHVGKEFSHDIDYLKPFEPTTSNNSKIFQIPGDLEALYKFI